MRHKPRFNYSGLTIVLSHPSRFDLSKKELLSGRAGIFINEDCLRPNFNRWQCDIRTADTINEGLLEGTKGILLLGEKAFYTWASTEYQHYLHQEQRGYLISNILDGYITPTITSFYPQDACDPEDFESRFNPILKQDNFRERIREIQRRIFTEETVVDLISEKRHHGKTARSNYKFWIREDCRKLLRIINYKGGNKEPIPFNYCIYPCQNEAMEVLTKTKNTYLFLDIETDSELNITCFSFCLSKVVYVVPIFRYNYSHAYTSLPHIFRALIIAMRDNTVVCHNSMFDLFVLAWKYNLPVGEKHYDTMLAHHRCWPEREKSLGHAISHLTLFERYHKDSGVFNPKNTEQERKLWEYNGRDVSSMMLVKAAIDDYSKDDPGLQASIDQANSMILPYLVVTIQGIRYSEIRRAAIVKYNDRLMTQYLRAIKLLVGPGIELLPTSHKQCTEYFSHMLRYPILRKSDKTGAPSWDENTLRQMKLNGNKNPVVDFCLAFRTRSKESGSLKFEPWIKE